MTPGPPMTFWIRDVRNPERMKDGPVAFFWGQDHERRCRHALVYGPRPKVGPHHWVRRVRPYAIDVRIAPPSGVDLADFGREIAARAGTTWTAGVPDARDTAIWLPGWVIARHAGAAAAAACKVLTLLGDLKASELQVRAARLPVDLDGALR